MWFSSSPLPQIGGEGRREFLRRLPERLINGIRSMTAAIPHRDDRAVSGSRIARLDITRCLAWAGASCQLCYLACPLRDQALEMRDLKPVLIPSLCDGCGMCVPACETVNDLPALEMIPRGDTMSRHQKEHSQ